MRTIMAILSTIPLLAGISSIEPAIAATDEVAALHALFGEDWDRRMAENPTWASQLGDKRHNRRWPDRSAAAREASLAADQHALQERIAAQPYKPWVYGISMRGGIQTAHQLLESMAFRAPSDWDDWLARLESFGSYMDQTIAELEEGASEGRTQPRVIMQRVPAQVRQQRVADPVDSPFYAPFRSLPDSLPASRDSVGIWDTPDGRAWYANRTASFTTTKLAPEEIHAIGHAEVKRIRAEMEAVIREVGFEGSFQDFLEHLRTDPKFYFQSPEELFQAYLATAKRIDPLLSPLFRTLPRTPYGVRPIPMSIAPDTTTAYYSGPSADGLRPGYYYVNLYRPEQRPKYEMAVLSMHEAVPGHHLQIALAQELRDMPKFRRFSGYTAFVEGWALYSESLGGEMGLYKDPYDRFGYLTYDMWRAVRLVVDTGPHYIGWPGQALAYKIGQLRIRALRSAAEEALGERFDIREFHDVVLAAGAVPLDVLEARVRAWISSMPAAP